MIRYLDPKADIREINQDTQVVSPELLSVPEISEAVSLAEEAAYSPAELSTYEAYWGAVSTEKTLWRGKYEEGEAKGKAAGKAEGKVEERRAIAQKMSEDGMDVSTISRLTGLSIDELKIVK
jgi:predicted transposase/invertase (TIGR01784 family)